MKDIGYTMKKLKWKYGAHIAKQKGVKMEQKSGSLRAV